MNTFNKASKITVTILLLALALSLGACSSSQNSVSPKDDSVTSSPISESETLPAAESQQGGNLSLITDPYGGIFRNGAGTSFGYYEIMSAQNNSLNILYTDYATDIRAYLCADPDCTHNSDTCTSWFSFLGSAYPFTSADGSKIYLVTTGYADNAGSISDEQNYGTIYQFDANGANRKVLYRLQSNEEFYGTAASDGEKLYVSIQVVDSNTSSSHWEVRCLDLSNGESSVIYTTDQYGERIFGAYANNLVIEEVTDTNRSYYTLDVITKQKSAPIYSYNYNDETRTELVNSKYVYSLRYDHEDLFSLFSIDLDTGVEKCIASNIVIYNTDSTNLSGFFDNHAIIETSDTRDTSNISHIQYNIDLSTGDCVTNTLQYTVDGDEKNVYILAETSDAFLVRNGVEEKEITVVDNTGVPSSLMASIPQYALIQKSDYWNGVSAYTPINDAL